MRQGIRTAAFPPEAVLPERFRGRPVLDPSRCTTACRECAMRAPSAAIRVREDGAPELDLGACLFSPEEALACPAGAIGYATDYRMAGSSRDALRTSGGKVDLAHALDERSRRLFGRSLKLRSVVAGSCNGCEAELVALGNVVFDLGRFGLQFVASPRPADGIVRGVARRQAASGLQLRGARVNSRLGLWPVNRPVAQPASAGRGRAAASAAHNELRL